NLSFSESLPKKRTPINGIATPKCGFKRASNAREDESLSGRWLNKKAAPPRGRVAGRLVFTYPRACASGYFAGADLRPRHAQNSQRRSRVKSIPFAPGNASEASIVCRPRTQHPLLVGRDGLLGLADLPLQNAERFLLLVGLS